MRFFTIALLATAFFTLPSRGAQPGGPADKDKPQKAGKGAPGPIIPKSGIKTPGIQIPFSLVTADATIPAAGKPSWVFFLGDSAAAGGPGGGGRGRGGGGGGRGNRGGGGAGAPAGAAGGGTGTLFIPAGDKLDKVETKGNKLGEPIAGLNKPCGGMVSAFGSLWVPTCGDGALQRIDAGSSKITATIASGATDIRGSIAASADSIWLLTDSKQTLSRIDPDQNAVVGEIRLPAGCNSMMFAETALWIACPEQNKVLKINPATNIVEKRIEVAGHPLSLAGGEGSIWVLCGKEGKVDRIDPKTDKVSKSIELSVPGVEGAIAYGEGFVWVTMTGFPVTRIDPTGESVAQQFRGDGGGALVTGSGALWLSNLSAGTVTRIDPKLLLATLAE
jgi:virginiamycin B lyase